MDRGTWFKISALISLVFIAIFLSITFSSALAQRRVVSTTTTPVSSKITTQTLSRDLSSQEIIFQNLYQQQFTSQSVTPPQPGTKNCKIVPNIIYLLWKFCPRCFGSTKDWLAGVQIIDPKRKIPVGLYGCAAADQVCLDWIMQGDQAPCNWNVGVAICHSVCNDLNQMPNCLQVAKAGSQAAGISTLGAPCPPFPIIQCGTPLPAGGCPCYADDTQCTSMNCGDYDPACPGSAPNKCSCSLTGSACTFDEDCCSYPNEVCVDYPNHVCANVNDVLRVESKVDVYGDVLESVKILADSFEKYTSFLGYASFTLSTGYHSVTSSSNFNGREFSHFWDKDCNYYNINYWLDTSSNPYSFQKYSRYRNMTAWYKVLTNITDLSYSKSTSTITGRLLDEKGFTLFETGYYHPTCSQEASTYSINRDVVLEYYQAPNWYTIDTVTTGSDGSFSKTWSNSVATAIRARYVPSNWLYNVSTSNTVSLCSGPISLSLSPNPAWTGQRVTATVSGLSNCNGKRVYVGVGQYDILRCLCTVSGSGCSCTFTAPTNGVSIPSGTMDYHAKIDMNGNGNYNDTGEKDDATLTIYCDTQGHSCNNHPGVSSPNTCCGSSYYCSLGTCQRSRGGCPTLFVYDGKDYVKERKSNIHSQPGIDTVDDIDLTTKPVVVNGNYLLQLKETTLPEHSYIDSVKLFVTDLGGRKEAKLVSAKHSKYGDVINAIAKSDDVRTDTQVFDNIELKFKVPELKGEAKFTFEIEGYNPAVNILDKGVSILGQVITGNMITKFDIADFSVVAAVVAVIAIILVFGFFKFFARKKKK